VSDNSSPWKNTLNLQMLEMTEKGVVKKCNGFTYECLGELEEHDVEGFIETYRKDKKKARVKIMLNGGNEKPTTKRIVHYYRNKHDWSIILYVKTWGINKNGIIYSSEKKVARVVYNSKGLWTIWNGGRVKSFQGCDVMHFDTGGFTTQNQFNAIRIVKTKMIERLPYIENLFKNDFDKISFNIVKNRKLYQLKRLVRYQFCIPLRVYSEISNNSHGSFLDQIKNNRFYLSNLDDINLEWFKEGNRTLLHDTMRFARALNKKVNCRWTIKRLESEHNKWSTEITEILYKGDGTPLTIADKFKEFEEFSGYKMLKTVDELFCEGIIQRHCVATYTPQINAGNSAIYHVEGYTLELNPAWGKGAVRVAQFRGTGNKGAPKELSEAVSEAVKSFNEMKEKESAADPIIDKVRVEDLVMDDLQF